MVDLSKNQPGEVRRVLFIAHSYPPENLVGALRPARFSKYLPNFGWEATVITGSAQPPGNGVHYVPDDQSLPERLFGRYVFNESVSWAFKAARRAIELINGGGFSAVFSTSPPFGVQVAGWRIKKATHLPWIADFRDPMIGNDFHDRFVVRATDAYLEPRFFRYADLLLANTDAAARHWRTNYPAYEAKIRTIYNGYDPDTATLRPAPIPRRPYRVLLHAGSLYSVSMTLPMLDCLDRALKRGDISADTFRLRMIGLVDRFEELRQHPSYRSLEAAKILACTPDNLPLAEARRDISEADFLLTVDRYRKGGIIQLPAKTFEYIQVGRPVLAFTQRDSPLEYLLKTSGIPHQCMLVAQDSNDEIDAKFRAFLKLPSDPTPVSETCEHIFGAWHQAQRLAELLDQVTR